MRRIWNSRCRVFVHRRAVHQRAPLPYNIEDGMGDFLPPTALKTIAVDYQEGLLQNLNDQVRGTDMQDKSVADTIIAASTSRANILAFNYASLALNNHFFLDRLKAPDKEKGKTNNQDELSLALSATIREQHGSLAQLKSAFSAAAMGMFTSGYVWFVTDTIGRTAVLPTFGPGSLLIRSRKYMISKENAETSDSFAFNPLGPFGSPERSPFATEQRVEKALDLQAMVKKNPELAVQILGLESATQLLNHEKLAQMIQKDESLADVLRDADKLAKRIQEDLELATVVATYFSHVLKAAAATPVSEVKEGAEESDSPQPPPSSRPRLKPRFIHTSARTLSSQNEFQPASLWAQQAEALPLDRQPTYTSQTTRSTKNHLIGETLYPLFCLSVHEHAWISAGYGVNGKEEYIKRFWSAVDWKKVSADFVRHLEADPQYVDDDYNVAAET